MTILGVFTLLYTEQPYNGKIFEVLSANFLKVGGIYIEMGGVWNPRTEYRHQSHHNLAGVARVERQDYFAAPFLLVDD